MLNNSSRSWPSLSGQVHGKGLRYAAISLLLVCLLLSLFFNTEKKGDVSFSRTTAAEAVDLSQLTPEELKPALTDLSKDKIVSFAGSLADKEGLWVFKNGKGKLFSLLFFKESPIPFIGVTAYTDGIQIPDEQLLKQADLLGPRIYQVFKASDLNTETEITESELSDIAQIYNKKSKIDIDTSIMFKRVISTEGENPFISIKSDQTDWTIIILAGAVILAVVIVAAYFTGRSKRGRFVGRQGLHLLKWAY